MSPKTHSAFKSTIALGALALLARILGACTFFEGEIPKTQDYYILVNAHPEDGADYTMTVIIPPPD